MKKFYLCFIGLLLGLNMSYSQTNMSSEMYDLAKMKEGLRNRRVSSYDRTGNNRDHLKAIKPGETAVLADIKGTGVINHIWITMSPGPRELSRNDIILRMYWDGNEEPSVVSPIGRFSAKDGTSSTITLRLPSLPARTGGQACAAISPCLLPRAHALKSKTRQTWPSALSITTLIMWK